MQSLQYKWLLLLQSHVSSCFSEYKAVMVTYKNDNNYQHKLISNKLVIIPLFHIEDSELMTVVNMFYLCFLSFVYQSMSMDVLL